MHTRVVPAAAELASEDRRNTGRSHVLWRFAEAALDIGTGNGPERVPFCSPQEGEDVVVDDIGDAGGQARAGERELSSFAKRVLHGGGEFA